MNLSWHRLVDDAAIFPPGNAPLDRAVAAHAEHRTSAYAALVGGFVVSDVRIPELVEVVGTPPEPLGVNVVVTGGAGGLEPAVRWAGRSEVLDLQAVEIALRDLDDLAQAARRVVAAADALAEELADVALYVEVPWAVGSPGWAQALDELATREVQVKFRTGGVTAEAFPSPAELAAGIEAALDRELPFKCTAGLHHAVRHTDTDSGTGTGTGLTHHGFLNVLLATRASLDGGDVVAALSETDPDAVAAAVKDADLVGARRWFTSFGSCSVLEPHQDLSEMGLL